MRHAVWRTISCRLIRIPTAPDGPKSRGSRPTTRRTRCATASRAILISEGKPIAYVQKALGHASISMTVDSYGRGLPVKAEGAVNVLAGGLDLGLPVTDGAPTGYRRGGRPQVALAT